MKVGSFNATPGIVEQLKDPSSALKLDVGGQNEWWAYATADQIFRVLSGAEPVENYNVGLRIFDESNADLIQGDDEFAWYESDGYTTSSRTVGNELTETSGPARTPAPDAGRGGLCRRAYSGVPVLSDVSLTLTSGEIVGLIGQNGSGKSTLIKISSGFHTPEHGRPGAHGRPRGAAATWVPARHRRAWRSSTRTWRSSRR